VIQIMENLLTSRNELYFIPTEIFGQNRSHEKRIREFIHLNHNHETTFSLVGKAFHPTRDQLLKKRPSTCTQTE